MLDWSDVDIAVRDAVREAGGEVVAVAVVVDRNTGSAERVQEAGLEYRYAVGLEDLGLA